MTGMTKPLQANQIQKGNYLVIEGAACKATDIQISRPGKHGHSKVRITAVGIFDDKKRVIVAPGHDNVDVPVVEKKNAQILSIHDTIANVMDMDSYETFDMTIPEELKAQAVDGAQVIYWIVLDAKVMKQIKVE